MIFLVSLVVILTTIGSIVSLPVQTALAAEASATADVTLRAGAGPEFEALTVIPTGSVIAVDGDPVNGYYPVTYTGIAGWVAADYLVFGGGGGEVTKDAAAEIAATGSATTIDAVNLRAGPSTDDAVIGELHAGTVVSLTGQQVNGFLEVAANGVTGWISAEFLSGADGSVAPAPVPVAAPAAEAAAVLSDSTFGPGGASYTEDEIVQFIFEAADKYHQPRADMLRVARCESNLDPNAINHAGNTHGLYQFLPGTWETTPYAEHSIYDPWANANAAGWMWSEGRRNEWVCQ
jgi:uncharacterized protein YraI